MPSLQNAGFIVIDRKNLVYFEDNDEKYRLSKTDIHPNEKAWDVIVPELVKYLK